MKKTLIIFLLLILSTGCASKKEPFDATAKFQEAEIYMKDMSFEKARKAYQEIQEKAPDKSYDPALMLRIADTYYGEEKYEEALVEYQAFLNYHPVHKDAPYAQYQIGMCNYEQFTTIDRDPEPVHTAIREFENLLQKFPNNPYEEQAKKYIAICRDRSAEYELYVARFYYKKDSYKAAAGRCEYILKKYPGIAAEKDALYLAGQSYVELGDREQALRSFDMLVKKYPAMAGAVAPYLHKLQPK